MGVYGRLFFLDAGVRRESRLGVDLQTFENVVFYVTRR